MRYRCASRASYVLMAVVAMIALQGSIPRTMLAQSAGPSFLPRLAFSDLSYAGAFRVPVETSNGDSLQYGGQALAFNPAKPSLFITSHAGLVSEISIPTPALTNNLADMPVAQFLQGFADPVEGRIGEVGSVGVWTNSLVVQNGRLFGTASVYYDALNQQRVSHFYRGLQLNSSNFHGFTQVWDTAKTGFVAGNLALVPAEWQQALGGAMVSGQCCVPIVSRTSWGPSAFAFDPNDIGRAAAPASPLLYYTQDHPTLGQWGTSNEMYGDATEMGGLVIVAGTRTALYFGRNGIGPACYGNGTDDASIVGTIGSDGAKWCYDPTNPYKGTHAYPYRYQIWAYDLNDLAAVKAGTKNPWDVMPYDLWPFALPTPESHVSIGGVTYDAEHQTIYLTQLYADTESRPVIHVLKVGSTGTALTPSQSALGQISTVITANAVAPQPAGTPITFAATTQGGTAPHQYKWMTTTDGLTWSAGSWSPSNQFTWTPSVENAHYKVRVWVRSQNNKSDQPEALATVPFPIGGSRAPAAAVTVAGTTSPQLLGAALTFTATANGGTAPYQFKWRVFDGAWSVRSDWGPSNRFSWTPSSARSDYRIEVSVRSAGNTSNDADASATVPFVIDAPAAVKVGGASLVSDVASPQPVGTSVRFTTNATGGAAPLQYKWSTFDGSSWTAVTGWTGAATFSWKPGAPGAYQIAVAVRSAGSSAEQGEASASVAYTMAAAATGGGGSSVVAAPFTSVSISSNRESPQAVNTPITWSASPSGSTAPALYKWLVNDGTKWVVAANWSASPTFSWVPAKSGTHLIGVWVKRATNYNDTPEAQYTTAYIVK
jgi:hypothetical protein